jgi:hypothetical protein
MKRIDVLRVVLAPALLSVLTVVMCAMPGSARLQPVGERELMAAVGGACLGSEADIHFCTCEPRCVEQGPNSFLLRTCTGAIKRWCGANGFGKVCNCNQEGVDPNSCVLDQHCSDPGCTDCEDPVVGVTVQSTVNLQGKPCTQDANCDS